MILFESSSRYAGAPVVFETVALDLSVTEEHELDNALFAIKRNGVGLKGKYIKSLTLYTLYWFGMGIWNQW